MAFMVLSVPLIRPRIVLQMQHNGSCEHLTCDSTHAVHGLLRWCLEKHISVLAFTVLIVDSFIAYKSYQVDIYLLLLLLPSLYVTVNMSNFTGAKETVPDTTQ